MILIETSLTTDGLHIDVKHAGVAQSSMVTTWNLAIGLGGFVGGALLAGFGSGTLVIATIVLLAPTLLVVVLARRHAFPAWHQTH